jgi:uncharacterized protein YqeY
MTLEEKINADLKTAMLAKNEGALRALRAVKAAILLAKTSGSGIGLTGDDEIKLLQKLVKQRKESLEIYKQQNREDLAKAEQEELDVIEKFLPAQMSEAEIKTILQQIISTMGATSPGDMGKVMGAASKQLAGKADNKLVSQLVKQLLGG